MDNERALSRNEFLLRRRRWHVGQLSVRAHQLVTTSPDFDVRRGPAQCLSPLVSDYITWLWRQASLTALVLFGLEGVGREVKIPFNSSQFWRELTEQALTEMNKSWRELEHDLTEMNKSWRELAEQDLMEMKKCL